MNKRILNILWMISIPVGALLLNSCGPVNEMDSELALDEASDNWIAYNGIPSEFGRCNDAWDNDGDGLTDSYDGDCHFGHPLRDLSVFNFPQGHNFFPDVSKIVPGGPGSFGAFRDRAQMTRWFRYLTEPDGNVAGIDLVAPGVNPVVVPTPAPLASKVHLGTAAQGNNNNVSLPALHELYLEHGQGILPPSGPVVPSADPYASTAAPYIPRLNAETVGYIGGWPGEFYKGGSQGALQPIQTIKRNF